MCLEAVNKDRNSVEQSKRARYWLLNSLSTNGHSTKEERRIYTKHRARHARLVNEYNKFHKSEQKDSDDVREAADVALADMLARHATQSGDTRANERSLYFSRFKKIHTDLYTGQSIHYHLVQKWNTAHRAYLNVSLVITSGLVHKQDDVQPRRPVNSTSGGHWKTYNHSWAQKNLKAIQEEKAKRERNSTAKFQKRSPCRPTSDDVFERAKAMVRKWVLKQKPHKPLDPDQWAAVEYALTQARDNKQCLMFVHGKWGTGKTRTINATLYGLKCMATSAACTAVWISFLESRFGL